MSTVQMWRISDLLEAMRLGKDEEAGGAGLCNFLASAESTMPPKHCLQELWVLGGGRGFVEPANLSLLWCVVLQIMKTTRALHV